MNDLISRQDAIDALDRINCCGYVEGSWDIVRGIIEDVPSAQPESRWIPFKTRPLTEEEKEDYPGFDCILDCKLPDDGQEILVSINVRGHECVRYDEFFDDDGSYLGSGYEIGTEAVAWQELPEPYKEENKK